MDWVPWAISQYRKISSVQRIVLTKRNRRFDNNIYPLAQGGLNRKIARVGGNGIVVDNVVKCSITPVGLERGSVKVPAVKVDSIRVRNSDIVLDGLVRRADGLLDDGHKLVKGFIFTRTEDTTDSIVLARVGVSSRVGSAARAACVVDDTSDVVGVDGGSTSILVVETQEVITYFLIGLDDYLIALSDVDG